MSQKRLFAPQSRNRQGLSNVCRSIALILWLCVFGPAFSLSAEDRPAEATPASAAFDRFDRTIVHINGQSVHVESRRQQAILREGDGNESDERTLVEVRFSHGVFENVVYGPKDDDAALFRRLESEMNYRVLFLASMFKLDGTQARKLQQAGRGDIQRIRERIDELKKRFSEPGLIEDDRPNTIRDWAAERVNEALALRSALTRTGDPFRAGSMLEKVLRRQLSPEQIVEYEAHELRVRTGASQIQRKARQAF